jgi:hypothetical protein
LEGVNIVPVGLCLVIKEQYWEEEGIKENGGGE